MIRNTYFAFVFVALAAAISSAQTRQIAPNVFRVEAGVDFTLRNAGSEDFLFSWSDAGGNYVDVPDPTLILTAGETYTFMRETEAHPFRITTKQLPVAVDGGTLIRTTTDGGIIDDASLTPIDDFTADPAPTTDAITWTPGAGDVDAYFYTCRVAGHVGMTGAIAVIPAAEEGASRKPSAADFLRDDGRFSALQAALAAADLVGALSGDDKLTLFAPEDEAFGALPAGTFETLLAAPSLLTDVLLYHVAPGNLKAKKLLRRGDQTTLEGSPILIVQEGEDVFINRSRVIDADNEVRKGQVHVIDAVLSIPADTDEIESALDVLRVDGRFETLLTALDIAGLSTTIADAKRIVIFAPTEEAFNDVPPAILDELLDDPDALAEVLLYHVAGARKGKLNRLIGAVRTEQGDPVVVRRDGDEAFVNGARVVTENLEAPRKVFIQVIDSVLLPPAADQTPVDILEGRGGFETLVTALRVTGLDAALGADGDLTLFAPTERAFAGLPPGTVESLLNDLPALADILRFHVVSGAESSDDLAGRRKVKTLEGGKIRIRNGEGSLVLNGSTLVLEANLVAPRTIIHIIDEVLLPDND
jgi:uncharacterized surface protein with fasciclin (FAS1) repeats